MDVASVPSANSLPRVLHLVVLVPLAHTLARVPPAVPTVLLVLTPVQVALNTVLSALRADTPLARPRCARLAPAASTCLSRDRRSVTRLPRDAPLPLARLPSGSAEPESTPPLVPASAPLVLVESSLHLEVVRARTVTRVIDLALVRRRVRFASQVPTLPPRLVAPVPTVLPAPSRLLMARAHAPYALRARVTRAPLLARFVPLTSTRTSLDRLRARLALRVQPPRLVPPAATRALPVSTETWPRRTARSAPLVHTPRLVPLPVCLVLAASTPPMPKPLPAVSVTLASTPLPAVSSALLSVRPVALANTLPERERVPVRRAQAVPTQDLASPNVYRVQRVRFPRPVPDSVLTARQDGTR